MNKFLSIAGGLLFAAQAHAFALAVPGSGDFTGVSITEAPGEYTVINASTSATVQGFGVTNPINGLAHIGALGDAFGGYDDTGYVTINGGTSGELWGAIVLEESDWGVYAPGFANGFTMEDMFGVWGFGSEVVNWYEIFDANGVMAGQTGTNFLFSAPPASQAFGAGIDNNALLATFNLGQIGPGNTGGNQSGQVPVPATLLMLLGGLGLVRAMRRNRA